MVPMLRMIAIFGFLFLASCGGGSTGGGNGSGGNDNTNSISGTIDEQSVDLTINDIVIQPNGIFNLGLIIYVSNISGGADDNVTEEDEQFLQIRITSTKDVTLEEDLSVGPAATNTSVQFEDGEDRYIGTSGSITFTKISSVPGDDVEFTFDIGFVTTDFENTKSASLMGTLMGAVEEDSE